MIPKVSEWKQQMFIFSEFHWGRNPGSVYLVVLVQVFSWGCTQGTGQSCSHFKAGLGMNSLPGSVLWLLTGFRSSLLTGDINSSPSKPLHSAAAWYGSWLPQSEVSDLREHKKEPKMGPQSFYDLTSEVTSHHFCHIIFVIGESL